MEAMALLQIVTGRDAPILRTKAKNIPKITKEIAKLVKNMQETVEHAEGAGLAAPQVGVSLRLCVAMVHGKYVPLINPEILWRSAETDTMEEGCLSLPGVWLKITRPVSITVKYLNAKGHEQERKLEGLGARVVQHEVDHLDGVLIVDHTNNAECRMQNAE